jgi:hygromycin-B 7''-O-kinase
MIGCRLYDLLGPMTFMAAGEKELQREFLVAYGLSDRELNDELRETFMTLLLLHRFSDLNGQIRMSSWQAAESFAELARKVFCF